MPIRYTRKRAHLEECCTVEEALGLVAFLAERPGASVALARCTALHGALVQVLLAFRPPLHGAAPAALAPLLPALTRAPDPETD
ncbi:hypothetical protein [Sphingomonas sp. BK235]|uniref:hypothetical protein n=1 Tax=Sphingomonas sp. BK235 TaxID=2512131 RepID=UPI0010514283|nr:hypothetical protein [Sphingomonas sp. BK235]TCP29660.1 hypothetical protein EV292_11611 [Sphingomonas sp. BK235]